MVDLPWKFQLSFISSYTSRGPFQPTIPGADLTGSGISGFPLPGMGDSLFNFGLGKSDLTRLVNQYNQTYAARRVRIQTRLSQPLRFPATTISATTFNSQDIRLTKLFRWHERYELQVFGEGFNIFNISNLTGLRRQSVGSGLWTTQRSRRRHLRHRRPQSVPGGIQVLVLEFTVGSAMRCLALHLVQHQINNHAGYADVQPNRKRPARDLSMPCEISP